MKPPRPPADLAERVPKMARIDAGEVLHRFFQAAHDPIYFDRSNRGRLNAPDGSYGVLYTARSAQAAFAETFLRSPGRIMLDPALIASRAYCRLAVNRVLNLIEFDGPGLAILGATAEVVHGSPAAYDVPQEWSKALKLHPIAADGIAYTSRHDPQQVCIALFDRTDVVEIDRETDLDADWFWELADVYRMGRPPS